MLVPFVRISKRVPAVTGKNSLVVRLRGRSSATLPSPCPFDSLSKGGRTTAFSHTRKTTQKERAQKHPFFLVRLRGLASLETFHCGSLKNYAKNCLFFSTTAFLRLVASTTGGTRLINRKTVHWTVFLPTASTLILFAGS